MNLKGCLIGFMVGSTGLLLAGALAVLVLRGNDPPPVDYAKIERDQIQLETERQAAILARLQAADDYRRGQVFWDNVAGVGAILLPALLLALPLGIGLALADQYLLRRMPLIWPREGDRALPLPRVNLLDDVHSELALEALDQAHITARVVGRSWPNVPQTLTLTNSDMPALPSGEEDGEAGIEVPPEELPGPFEMSALLESGWRPSMENIIQGVGVGRKVIADKLPNLLHMALTGETNKGKSNMVRFFLAQILYAGAEAHLLDTHYADVDPISGDDWRPIKQRLAGRRALTEEREIYDTIKRLQPEIKRRLALRAEGKHPGPPVFYVIEELPSISKRYPDFMEHLGFALREGRKIQIYIIIASQTLLISTIGGDSGIRSQFQTRYYAGGDAATYTALFPKCRLPEPDQIGVVILKSAKTGQPTMVRVPYVANDSLWRLLDPAHAPARLLPPALSMGGTLAPPTPNRPAVTVLDAPPPPAPPSPTQPLGAAPPPPVPAERPADAVANEVATVPVPAGFDYAKVEAKRQAWLSQFPATDEEQLRAYSLYMAGLDPAQIVLELRGINSGQGVTYQAHAACINEGIRQAMIKYGGPQYVIHES